MTGDTGQDALENSRTSLEVNLVKDTVWLSLNQIAVFFEGQVLVRSVRIKIHLDIRSTFSTIFCPEVVEMKITKDIKPVTYLKSRAADLLNQINESHRPVVITQNGESRAVLLDPESYENMRNAIGLLKLISQGESDVRNGKVKPQEEVFKDIENSLKEKLR